MACILNLVIPAKSKTKKSASNYRDYLVAYRNFAKKKRIFAPNSNVKVDSQFSEKLAADYFSFDVNHSSNLDGVNPITGQTYEVKATGFSNNRVRFNSQNIADHVIWIKVYKNKVVIREIDNAVYNSLEPSNGFINLSSYLKTNPTHEISKIEYTY